MNCRPLHIRRQRPYGHRDLPPAQPLRTPILQSGAVLALTTAIMLGWLVFGYLKFVR